MMDSGSLLPAVFFQHVNEFDDELALFVLLGDFERVLVLPAEVCVTGLAEDVSDCMESSEEDTLLCRSAVDVDDGVEEIGTTLTALKGLGDQLVTAGQMCTAVDAAVSSVAVFQVGLESLRHDCVQFTGSLLCTKKLLCVRNPASPTSSTNTVI